jgi:hypothetical protein
LFFLSQIGQLVSLWCLTLLSTIFQLQKNMMAVSFIGGGCTWRKPPTCHKSLTNFIT